MAEMHRLEDGVICRFCSQQLIWHSTGIWVAWRELRLGWCSARPADPGDDHSHVPVDE